MPIECNPYTRRFEERPRSASNEREPYFLAHEDVFHPQAIKEWARERLKGAQVVPCRHLSDISNGDRVSTAGMGGFIKAGWLIYSAIKIVLEMIEDLRELSKKYYDNEPRAASRSLFSDRTNEPQGSVRGARREPEFKIPEKPLNRGTLPVRTDRGSDRDGNNRSASLVDGRRALAADTARVSREGPPTANAREGFRNRDNVDAKGRLIRPSIKNENRDRYENNSDPDDYRSPLPRPMGGPGNLPLPKKDDPKNGDRDSPPKHGHGSNGDRGSKDDDRKKEPSKGAKSRPDENGWYPARYDPRG